MAVGNFGIIGTKYIDTKPNVDEAYIAGLATASGLDLADLLRLTDQAMGQLNGEIDTFVSQLIGFTTNPEANSRRIGRKYVRKGGEYTIARSQRGSSTTHMLPIDKYDISIGFTEDGLHDISLEDFNGELADMVTAWRSLYTGEVLSALFDPNPVPVHSKSTVLSPRFAGSGTGSLAFAGTFPSGGAIPGNYTHYFRTADANVYATISSMLATLRRWHPGPYQLVGSAAAIDQISALAQFIPVATANATVALGQAVSTLDPATYVGTLPGNIQVQRPVDAIGSTKHFALFKSYGDFSDLNPLAWLYDAKWGRDAIVRSREDYPLAESVVIQRFGIGANDRTAATLGEINNSGGAYVAPTPSF